MITTLQWRPNECDVVLNHRRPGCLLSHLFMRESKKKIKAPSHWPLWGNPPVTDGFPSQRVSNALQCCHLMTSSWCAYFPALEKVSYNNDLVHQIPTAKLPVTVFLVTLCLGVSEYAVLYHCEIKNTRRTFLKGKWNALGLSEYTINVHLSSVGRWDFWTLHGIFSVNHNFPEFERCCTRLGHVTSSQIVLYFLHSTSVLSFYLDVVLPLSMAHHLGHLLLTWINFNPSMDK